MMMSKFLVVMAVLAGLALTTIGASTAHASSSTLCESAYGVRQAVIDKHGKRAPGRNICRYGVRSEFNSKWVRPARTKEKAQYLRTLRRLNNPPPFLTAAGAPKRPPAGTLTPRANLPACTWVPESGGDYGAYNASSGAAGKYQIIPSTWAAFGGTQYAPSAGQATPAQQDAIAAKIAGDGLHHWVNC